MIPRPPSIDRRPAPFPCYPSPFACSRAMPTERPWTDIASAGNASAFPPTRQPGYNPIRNTGEETAIGYACSWRRSITLGYAWSGLTIAPCDVAVRTWVHSVGRNGLPDSVVPAEPYLTHKRIEARWCGAVDRFGSARIFPRNACCPSGVQQIAWRVEGNPACMHGPFRQGMVWGDSHSGDDPPRVDSDHDHPRLSDSFYCGKAPHWARYPEWSHTAQ